VRPFAEAHRDQDDDHDDAREERRVPVECRPVLVAPSSAEDANRLAAATEREHDADVAKQREREQPLMKAVAEPRRSRRRTQ
jgi:hypothetical protein